MKHVTYADKSVLMGDDAADVLLEYARLLADSGRADSVTLQAISPDGNTVDTSFLLSPSSTMMMESTNTDIQAPNNDEVVAEIKERIAAIARPAPAETEEHWAGPDPGLSDYL